MVVCRKSLVSVIIPIHNEEKNLDKCVRSVACQTYFALEILLIENGSTDESRVLCENWLKRDSRIKAKYLEEADLSLARNTGMRIAKGDWIVFVDADDAIDSRMIEKMVEAGTSSTLSEKIGIVDCDWKSENRKKQYKHKREGSRLLTGMDYARLILRGNNSGMSVWNKMFRKELIPWLFFLEGHLYESKVSLIRAAIHCGYVCMIPEQLYIHQINKESITNTIALKNEKDRLISADQLVEMTRDMAPSLLPEAKSLAVKLYTLSWLRLQFCEKEEATIGRIQQFIHCHVCDVHYGKVIERIAVYLTGYVPSLGRIFFHLYIRFANG